MGRFTKRFTEEQERAILSLFFTNPFGKVSFVFQSRDFGPEEQATFAARYSRSGIPYQGKLLRLIESNPNINTDLINKLVANPDLANANLLLGEVARRDSARFHTRWSLGMTPEEKDVAVRGFGDDSIKDAATTLYHVDDVPDLVNKLITGNPKNKPQVVSTRYLDRSKALALIRENVDIHASRYAEEIFGLLEKLGEAYVRFSEICATFIENHPLNRKFRSHWLSEESIIKEVEKWERAELKKDPTREFTFREIYKKGEEFRRKREEDYSEYARKTVYDFTRYLLTPAIPTSMANATDARTLEEDISILLSDPLQTSIDLGNALLREGAKIMPTLLGERTHARRSEFNVRLREELTDFVSRLEFERVKAFEITSRVNYIDRVPSFTDPQLAAALVFPYSHGSMNQLYQHFKDHPEDIRRVVDIILRSRKELDPHGFEPDPMELLQGGLMRETLIDWGADRDIQRHRRGHKSRQLLSTHHGYEVPDLFPLVGLEKEFRILMEEADRVFKLIENDNPFVAQFAVPFAYKVRRLYSWQFGQDLFFAKLRSGEGGIISYRRAAWDIERADSERMPLFSQLFRVNHNEYPPELINLKEARVWYLNKRSK